MGKILGHIDLKPYFEWYADLLGVTVKMAMSDKRGFSPLNMLSEWMERYEKPCSEFIGKEVYFSIIEGLRDEICYDSFYEGVCICKGIVEEVTNNSITISGVTYKLSYYSNGMLFESLELCLLHVVYDGDDAVIDVGTDGTIFISNGYSDDLVNIEC